MLRDNRQIVVQGGPGSGKTWLALLFGIVSLGLASYVSRPTGTLAEEQPKVLPQEVIVATMEALLIEGLEPPQNRRGDDFRAIEYIQREDPELERRRLASLLGEIQSRLNLR
jgi:hypothetical protein